MLSSIHPLGERARGQRWWLTVSACLGGSLLGGATTGALLGLLGSPLPGGTWTVAAVAVASVAAIGVELIGRRPPSWHRQVNEEWLTTYRGWVYGLGFGYQLGLGVVTIITTGAVYVMLLAALLSGSVLGGLVIGATFGLVRGLAILAAVHADTPDRLRSLHRSIASAADGVRWATAGSLVAVGAAAVAVVATS